MSQSEYNLSSEMSAQSLYIVSSNLSMQAAESSHVDCLASVSALHTPLISRVHLTVGETKHALSDTEAKYTISNV